MKLLGVDFESTGLDTAKDRIIEVGAVLWDAYTHTPVKLYHAFLHDGSYPKLSAEIELLTGITEGQLHEFADEPHEAFHQLFKLLNQCDYVVAHNGTLFDKVILLSECKRQAMNLPEIPWIDTTCDVPYPPSISTRRLTHLAAEHGFLNPFPHRAVTDVLTMLKVLSHYDLKEVVKYAKAPSVTIRALVDYNTRLLASGRSFRWNAEKKEWRKTIKDFQLMEETQLCEKAGFKIEQIIER